MGRAGHVDLVQARVMLAGCVCPCVPACADVDRTWPRWCSTAADTSRTQIAPLPRFPASFLVGDRNPLHTLVKDLRTWFDDCKQDILCDLVHGGDHDKEDRALDRKKALAILDWLSDHERAHS